MTKQNNTEASNFDEFDFPRRRFDTGALAGVQDIVSPYPMDNGRYNNNRRFSAPPRRYYKRGNDFTPEERSKILARVSEVGATRAADEFGTRRWVIMQWLDNLEKFGTIDNPKQKNQKNKNRKRKFSKRDFESQSKKTQENSPPALPVSEHKRKKVKKEKIEPKTVSQEIKNFEFDFSDILTKPVQEIPNLKLKESKDFSLAERDDIMRLSDEIGIKNAALQANTKIETIKYWRKLRKKAAKEKTQMPTPDDSIVTENEKLKAKLAKLSAEVKKLTKKFSALLKEHRN